MVVGGFVIGLIQEANAFFSLGLLPTWSDFELIISGMVLMVCSAEAFLVVAYPCIYGRFPQWLIDRSTKKELDQFVKLLTSRCVPELD